MQQCLSAENTRLDIELNRVYNKFMKKMKKDTSPDGLEIVKRIKDAENAWIKFRDTSCSLDGATMLVGTGQSLVVVGCLNKMTDDRTKYILGLEQTFGPDGGAL